MNKEGPRRPVILFVDDDVAVLQSLQDLLYRDRHRWTMAFAAGGEQALEQMRRRPADIIVSDMRMPGMDGADLLARIKAEYPGTARIVLSGHAEREAVLRAVPVAQQFLSKPCDARAVRSMLERTSDLQSKLRNPLIRNLVGGLDKLPSLPQTYVLLTNAAADPATGVERVAGIIERDQAMSLKVLQLVNSAYFGIAREITTVRAAVLHLGMDLIRSLALGTQVFGLLPPRDAGGLSAQALQDHATLTASLARRFLTARGTQMADEAFTAALMHDLGKVVLALGLRDQYRDIARQAAAAGRPLHEVETDSFGVTHADVGAYLLGLWGLPFSIVESVACHHRPQDAGDEPSPVVVAVYVANAVAKLIAADRLTMDAAADSVDLPFLQRIGHGDELARWIDVAQAVRAGLPTKDAGP